MSPLAATTRFLLHLFEMCVPMCIGFAVGDYLYFRIAGAAGYPEPFEQLPVLSLVVVTFNMTAPMVAWMRFRGMPRRETVEMAGSMVVLALGLLALGIVGLVPLEQLALAEHAAMMPAMAAAMLLRRGAYTGSLRHAAHGARSVAR